MYMLLQAHAPHMKRPHSFEQAHLTKEENRTVESLRILPYIIGSICVGGQAVNS